MTKYTVLEDHAADEVVAAELSLIVSHLKPEAATDVEAVFLGGGFGRGEGTVVFEEGRYRPMNDYDIVVVVRDAERLRGSWTAEVLREVSDVLTPQLLVKQVDIMTVERGNLAIPVPSVARYELKWGTKLLYGRGCRIRSVPAWLLPLQEGTRYFRTRAGGLLIARLLMDRAGDFPEGVRRELAFLEINKAYLAAGDAYLLRGRRYHYSYARRAAIVGSHYRRLGMPHAVMRNYVEAVDAKLRLTIEAISRCDLENSWREAATIMLAEFLKFESGRFRRTFADLVEYACFVRSHMFAPDVGGIVRRIRRLMLREDKMHLAQQRVIAFSLLAAQLNPGDERWNEICAEFGGAGDGGQWEEMTIRFLRGWHPEGIVAKLIGRRYEAD